MIRLAINGARGRMGARLCDLAREDSRFRIVAELARDAPRPPAGAVADVVIDVSSDEGARRAIELALEWRSSVLIATTALLDDTRAAARAAAEHSAVMIAPNTSVGVAVMKHLAANAAHLLGELFDVSIVEFHHTAKKDAPSGTALALAASIERATGRKIFEKNLVGIRVGDVIGEHSLRFSGPAESLEITHRAASRDLFVRGALRAAAWLAGREPGLYTIEQALGIDD